MKSVQATQEVLGIYLSCLEGTLAYNLPTLIPVGEAKEEAVREALEKVLEAHPHLSSTFEMKDETLYLCEGNHPLVYEAKEAKELDKQALIRPFELLNAPYIDLSSSRPPREITSSPISITC